MKLEAKAVGWQPSDEYSHSYVIHRNGETVALVLGREDAAKPVAEEIAGASQKIEELQTQVHAQARTISGYIDYKIAIDGKIAALEYQLKIAEEAIRQARQDGLTGHLHCACYLCKALEKIDAAYVLVG